MTRVLGHARLRAGDLLIDSLLDTNYVLVLWINDAGEETDESMKLCATSCVFDSCSAFNCGAYDELWRTDDSCGLDQRQRSA